MMVFFFFFNDTATTEIYTLSLHDALPISGRSLSHRTTNRVTGSGPFLEVAAGFSDYCLVQGTGDRSEEHTSELQSRLHLVCRLLLEKKNKNNDYVLDAHRTQPHASTCVTD